MPLRLGYANSIERGNFALVASPNEVKDGETIPAGNLGILYEGENTSLADGFTITGIIRYILSRFGNTSEILYIASSEDSEYLSS